VGENLISPRDYRPIAACRRATELFDALADALERDDECIDDIISAVGAALQIVGHELLRANDPAD
jgi:DNA-binding FrmR family transcriptional regulator